MAGPLFISRDMTNNKAQSVSSSVSMFRLYVPMKAPSERLRKTADRMWE